MCISTVYADATDTHHEQLTFGVFPYLPADKLEQLFAPIAARFSEIIGQPMVLRSRPDFDRFREQVSQQTYDIIFIQPFDYVRVAADNGYIPLACWSTGNNKSQGCNLKAVIVTLQESGIGNLEDLRGHVLGTPHPETAVALLVRHALIQDSLQDHIEIVATGNHNNCMQQVIIKKVDACITALPPATLFQKENNIQFRIIFESKPIPSTTIAAHRRLSPEIREKLRAELLSWSRENDTHKKLLHGGSWTHMCPMTDANYDPVRLIWKEFETSSSTSTTPY